MQDFARLFDGVEGPRASNATGCDSRMAGNDPPFDAVRANRAAGAGAWLPQPGVTHARPKRPGMGGARNVRTSARMRKSRPVRRIFAESARSGAGAGSGATEYGANAATLKNPDPPYQNHTHATRHDLLEMP